MEEKDFKKFTDAADKNLKDLKDALETKADASVVEDLKSELIEKISGAMKVEDKDLIEYVKELQTHADGLEEKINEFVQKTAKKAEHPEVTLDNFLTSDEYKELAKLSKAGETMKTKVLTVGSDLTAGNNPVILPEREAGVSAAPRADTPIYNLVQKGATVKDKISWIERTLASESPGTAMKAENNAFGESDALWTEVDIGIKKITDSFRATNEILEDTDFVRSEVMAMLTTNIPHLRETQLLSGTGLTVNMTGLITSAKTFSLPSGIDSVTDPNNFDVLKSAMTQVLIGYNGSSAYTRGYQPNAVVMNPVDALNMELLKDANDNYLLPTFFTANGMVISGVPVIKTFDISAGTYLVGDMSVGKYFTRRGMQVKFWDQYDTDPAYDRVMFTATERGALRVTNIGAYGLVTGTFAAGKTALTP